MKIVHRGIDFFDVDHTITRHSSGRRILVLGLRKGEFPFQSLLSLPFFYLRYRFGALKPQTANRRLPFLLGKSREGLQKLAGESFRQALKADIYPEALELIRKLKATGRKVVLATSSVDIVVQPLADYLGVDDVIASALEFVDNTCTGSFLGRPLFEQHKKIRVLEYIQENGCSAADCSFYSDSIYDLPLLQAIGSPVAVNPDSLLKGVALKNDWTILKFN